MTELLQAPQGTTDGRPTAPPLEPLWFLRTNPLRRRRLVEDGMCVQLESLSRIEQQLREESTRLSDCLYAMVADAPAEDRGRLVALRRAVHNDRRPAAGDPPVDLTVWLDLRSARDAALEQVRQQHSSALEHERLLLAEMLGDDDLRRALMLVAPEVARQAERYRVAVAGDEKVPSRILKSERGLLQYVVRACVRTSPLSRLTAVGLATASPLGQPIEAAEPGPAHPMMTLDHVMLGYVLAGVPGCAPIGDEAVVGIAPTSALDGGRLYFLAEGHDGLRRASLVADGHIGTVLNLLQSGPQPRKSLCANVSRECDLTDDQAKELIEACLSRGILTTFATGDDQLGAGLLDSACSRATDEEARLLISQIRAGLEHLAEAAPQERSGQLGALDGQLRELSTRARRPARVTVQEDFVLSPAQVDPSPWRPALDDLGDAVDLLSTFDWLQDVRVLLCDAFVRRFGAGARVSLVREAPGLVADVSACTGRMAAMMADPTASSADLASVGPADGTIARLHALRQQVSQYVHERYDEAQRDRLTEVRLDPQVLRELLQEMPHRLTSGPCSYGVLVQAHDGRLVFNDGLPGHGMLYSRFLAGDHQLRGQAREHLAQRLRRLYGAPGVRLVEDRGVYGLNVNVHPQVLPDVLLPMDWARLELAHDPATDTLVVLDGDQPLRVLPLGGGHPGLYPPALSIASGIVLSGRLLNKLPDEWHARRPWDSTSTRSVPRTLLGDVVISRRRWYGGQPLAGALGCTDEVDRHLQLSRWRREHDAPAEHVIKTVTADSDPESVGSQEAMASRLKAKPQYVDLDSTLCTRVLPRLLERRGGTEHYLEEARPGVLDGPHATEWVVEMTRPPHGRYRYGGL